MVPFFERKGDLARDLPRQLYGDCRKNCGYGGDKQRFRPYLDAFNAIIREIAAEHKLPVIPLDEIFTGLTQDIDPAQFTTDGVHPTHRGCRYIADLVIKELKKVI